MDNLLGIEKISVGECQELTFQELQRTWKTPNTYTNQYDQFPEKPGVYAIVWLDIINTPQESELLYIGSAQNIKRRIRGHEVIKIAGALVKEKYIITYFKEAENYKEMELKLIKSLKPIINKIGRK